MSRTVNPWMVAPVVAMAAFMEILDVSIANVSLQHIAGDMSASQEQSTWILTSYLVTNAVILPLSGWFSSVIGRKRFFIFCIIGFTASSLLCGLSASLPMLIAFRAVQGLTGGGLQPSSLAIITDAFPPAKRGMAFALFGMAAVMAPTIGPTLGGWITDDFSWRWIFLINLPVGLVLVPLIGWLVEDPPDAVERRKALLAKGVRIDYLGFILLAIGLGCLQVVLDKGQEKDWLGSPMIVWMSVGSVLGLVAFVLWELGQDDPIVDLHLFANRNYAACNFLNLMLGFMVFGTTALMPLMVQSLFGYTATLAGMVLSPGGASFVILMPLVGRLLGIVDARKMVAFGIMVDVVALYLLSTYSLATDYTTFALTRILQTIGMGFLFIPISTLLLVDLPREKNDQASSMSSLARNLGGSIGISLLTTWLTRDTQVRQAYLVEHVRPDSAAYRAMVDSLSNNVFAPHGGSSGEILLKAQAEISNVLMQQASLLAYLDTHRAMAILFALMLPLAFIVKRQPTGEAASSAVH